MNQKKIISGMLLWSVMATLATFCMAQSMKKASDGSIASPATRYFQLTLVLKYPESTDALPQPGNQSITTEVAVNENRPGSGSCRTRMTSQLPVTTSGKTRFIELGTKFDCNDVHVEGNGLALSIILETSRVNGFVATKDNSGVETTEPVITQQNLALAVRLPLDISKVIFDSNDTTVGKLKPLQPSTHVSPSKVERMTSSAMQIEMTAHELK